MFRRRLLSQLAVCCLSGLATACLEPTEVELVLSTDAACSDLNEVQIVVGSLGALKDLPPVAVARRCESGELGNLFLTPGSARDGLVGIQVAVGLGQRTSKCVSDGFEGACIVARRAVHFVPHRPLRLPIELSVDCLGIPCGTTETCRSGQCVPALVEDPLTCTLPGGCEPSGGGSGVGGRSSDGGTGLSGGSAGGGSDSGGTNAGGGGASGGSGVGGSAAGGAGSGGSGGSAAGGAGSGGSAAGGAGAGGSGGTAAGGAGSGGSAAGGAGAGGSGGTAAGGAGSGGGTGGVPEALCGNGAVEAGEACDDSNLADNDGCTAGCLNEYLMVSHLAPGRVALYDLRDGHYVRDLITEIEAGTGFFPTYLTQVNGGDVYVADSNLDKIFRYAPGDFGFEALVPAIQLGMTWSGDSLLMVDDPGISRFTTRPLTSAGAYSSLTQLWALDRINDRFQVAADAGFGVVYQIDSTGQIAELELYDGAFATGLTVTADGRLLIAETNADQVVMLVGSVVADVGNPLGAPMVTWLTVNIPSPFSVGELVGYNWLVGSAQGLFLVDPEADTILSTLSTDSIRAINRYAGP